MNQEIEPGAKQIADIKQTWDLGRTNGLVEQVFGREQRALVQPCLRSIIDRQNFARYHYNETNRLLKNFHKRYLRDRFLLEVTHGSDEAASMAFERLMMKVGAHVTACIQAMHAIPDILASGVYFALGLNLRTDALRDRAVNIATVTQRVKLEPDWGDLAVLLDEVSSGDKYEHVAAVSNLSKHRTVIRASLNMDMTGIREKQHEFHITSFEKTTANSIKLFPSISLADLLEDEFSRVGWLVIQIGHKMDEILSLKST